MVMAIEHIIISITFVTIVSTVCCAFIYHLEKRLFPNDY